MTDSPYLSLAELGRWLTPPDTRPVSRRTLINRGRQFAETHGLRIYTVSRHSSVMRAAVLNLPGLDVEAVSP